MIEESFFSSNTAVVGFVLEQPFSLCISSRTKDDTEAFFMKPEACLHNNDLLKQYCFVLFFHKVEDSDGNIRGEKRMSFSRKHKKHEKTLLFSSWAKNRCCNGVTQHFPIHILNSVLYSLQYPLYNRYTRLQVLFCKQKWLLAQL